MRNTDFLKLNYRKKMVFPMVFKERLKQLENLERDGDLDEEDQNELEKMRKTKADRDQLIFYHEQQDRQFREQCANALFHWCSNMGLNIPDADIKEYVVDCGYDIESVQQACYML